MGLSAPGPAAPARIGLLGGSFDPIHAAHLVLAAAARDHLGARAVHLIPAAAPWQRAPLSASPAQRLDMVGLAVAPHAGLVADPIEVERGGPSYTVDTVEAMARRFGPGVRLFWILGTDQLANFCTWHQWERIVALSDLAVATRPGTPLQPPEPLAQALRLPGRALHRLPMPEMAVSASDIRHRLAHGQPVDGLLPPPVLRYIAQHRLYQT